MEQKDKIEIPFGAFDSEFGGFEYTIPEGLEAEVKDGKVIFRKSESEDEKIRKALIKLVKKAGEGYENVSEGVSIQKAISWLEKQGEEIIPLKEFILNVWEIGNYWKELTKGVCNTEHGTQLDYTIKHWKEGEYYIKFFNKQGEQKPVIVPKFRIGDKVKKGYLTYTVEDIGEDSYKLQAYSKDGNKGCTVFLTIGYEKDYELVEQKPEWSEEDKNHINTINRALYDAVNITPIERELAEKWLKSIRPQSKQEWRDEDKRMIRNLQSEFSNFAARKIIKESTYQKYSDWLKSLHPPYY